ncbi:MAG: MarR family winged helix-turn-helix transcriptional regulator [Planctomycetota bacterium]
MAPTTRPDRPTPPPHEARSLGFLLRELYGRLQAQVYGAVAAAHPGVRPTHSPVLRHLPPEGGRVADLARLTGLAKQSVSYVVDDLVALGYLRSQPDPDDGRARRLTYTARGRALLACLAEAGRDAEAALAARLGVARVRALRATLEAAVASPIRPPA